MPRLDNAAKAAKALEKLVKSTINPAEKASVSLESKKAGLDKIKGTNIFADVSVPINGKSKNMELTRDQYAAELHRLSELADRKSGSSKSAVQAHLKALVNNLHSDFNNLEGWRLTDAARKAARLVSNNPTLSANDIGNVLNHHINKGNVVGHFSQKYLTHLVNTKPEERNSVHSLVKTLTTTKELREAGTGAQANTIYTSTRPKVDPKDVARLLGMNLDDVRISGGRGITSRNTSSLPGWGGYYIKGAAVDKAIKMIKRKASVFTDAESRAYFYQMVEDELKTPNGNSLDDIAATVKMLMG